MLSVCACVQGEDTLQVLSLPTSDGGFTGSSSSRRRQEGPQASNRASGFSLR